jgi:hypothetical protein
MPTGASAHPTETDQLDIPRSMLNSCFMLCEECQERDATIFIMQMINGEELELSLCRECAGPLADEAHQDPPERRDCQWFSSTAKPPAPHPDRPTVLDLPDRITVRDLASALKARPFELIKLLMDMNVFCSVNQEVTFAIAARTCARFGVVARRKV